MSKTKNFLKNFLSRTNIPGLGTKEGRQAKYDESKKSLFGQPLPEYGVSEFLQMPDRSGAIKRQEEREEEKAQLKLGDSFNQNQLMKDLYGLQAQQSVLRDYEMGREAKRNMAAAQQYFQMASQAAETAARRRLMEDQFSPTKISQQRLRAQQGDAALMNAISNQQNAATNAARSGINPRGRAGGA